MLRPPSSARRSGILLASLFVVAAARAPMAWADVPTTAPAAVVAAPAAQGTAAQGTASLDAAKPLIRATTVAIAYADMAKVDMKAAAEWYESIIKAAPNLTDADRADLTKDAASGAETAHQRVQQAREAGLQAMYFIMEMPGPGSSGDPVIALKLAEGADVKKVCELMDLNFHDEPVVIGDLTVLGQPAQIEKLRAGTAAKRPEFDKAIAVAGDGPFLAVVAPPPGSLNILPMTFPELPPEYGGVETKKLTEGVQSFVLAGTFPPALQGSVRILAAKPEQLAAALKQTKDASTATIRDGKVAGLPPEMKSIVPMLEKLPDPVAGDGMVTIALDEATARTLAESLVPALVNARTAAMQQQAMSGVRQLLMGVMMYSNENKGSLPASIDAVEKYVGGPDNVARLMTIEKTGETFVYRKPSVEKLNQLKSPATVVLIHSPTTDRKADDRIIVGFADGHVETLTLSELQARVKDGTVKLADEGGTI